MTKDDERLRRILEAEDKEQRKRRDDDTKYKSYSSLNKGFEKKRWNIQATTHRKTDRFTVLLTHDVDSVKPTFLRIIYTLLTQGRMLTRGPGRTNPYWTFDDIMAIEKRFDAKATWFFITSKKERRSRFNPFGLRNYSPQESKIGKLMRKIEKAGHEIGLHTGYHSFNDVHKMSKEKRRLETVLNKKVRGVRNHHLNFDVRKTWNIQEKCGFAYDSTYGYNDAIGYRNGRCHAFHAIDITTGEPLHLIEFPLTVMDRSLEKTAGKGKKSLETCKNLIDKVAEERGVMVINWHNSSFSDNLHPGLRELFTNILEYCKQKEAWMPTMREYCKKIGGIA